MLSKEELKKILRDQNKCNNCEYGVFVNSVINGVDQKNRKGFCTRLAYTVEVYKDNKCTHWKSLEIDEKTTEEYNKFRVELKDGKY